MLLVYSSVLLFTLLTIHLSPATVGVGAAAVVAGGPCLECPLEDERGSRGKLSFNPIIAATDEGDYLKAIALANSPGTLVGGGGGGVSSHEQREHEHEQQQKSRFYHAAQQLQHQQKILAQQQQRVPSSSAPSSPSNLLHFYTLLNKGSGQEPRVIFDGYYLQDSGVPIPTSRIAKKAERGMLVDVLDYVSKPDDRNRRVGQSMRSSG